jgi:AcrR family transcriptional regulator
LSRALFGLIAYSWGAACPTSEPLQQTFQSSGNRERLLGAQGPCYGLGSLTQIGEGEGMPGLKNPDWRNTIPEVVLDMIARDGLEAASIRRIAKELGYSTTVVTHTFPEKNELLLWSYHRFVDSGDRKFEAILATDPTDLVGYMMSMTALDDEDLTYWRAYVAIWDKVLSDGVFTAELRAWIERGVGRIERFVTAYNPDCENPHRIARQLLALARGISEQQILDRDSWSRDEVREFFTRQVECALGPPRGAQGRRC